MSGRIRKVSFSEEPLKVRWVKLPFGKKYMFNLLIEATTEELDDLLILIAKLDETSISSLPLSEHSIRSFITHVKQLLDLHCMLPHREYIKTSTRNLFFHLIHYMPNHPIQPGCPGHKRYVRELESIDTALTMINLELSKINVINTNSMLSLQQPSEPYHFGFHGLPHDLSAFIQSIDVSIHGCLERWETQFNQHSTQILSNYLARVTTSIQQIIDDDEIDAITYKLERFIKKLKKHGFDVQHDMFSDVASNGNRSPLRSPHATQKKQLKSHLNRLLESEPFTFNDDFSMFRQALSMAKNTPNIKLNALLKSLHHDMLAKNISPELPQTQTVQNYLCQALERTEHPLPEQLHTTLDGLLLSYTNQYHKRHKLMFLTTLLANIKIHPEKTYAECHRLTKASSPELTQALLTESSCLTLFGRHRFKNFIAALLQAEPDYEQSHPSSETRLNSLDCY